MQKKILIVHKELDTIKTIKTILQQNGYTALTSETTKDCINLIQKEKPKLILMESFFPREEILRATQKIKGIRILYLISDDTTKEDAPLYKNVIGFISEPKEINTFLKQIDETWQLVK